MPFILIYSNNIKSFAQPSFENHFPLKLVRLWLPLQTKLQPWHLCLNIDIFKQPIYTIHMSPKNACILHVCVHMSGYPCDSFGILPAIPAWSRTRECSRTSAVKVLLRPCSRLPPVVSIRTVSDSFCADVDSILSVALPRILRVLAPSLSTTVNLYSNNKKYIWRTVSSG